MLAQTRTHIHTYILTHIHNATHTYRDLESGLSISVYMEHCQITNHYSYCTFFCIGNLECGVG